MSGYNRRASGDVGTALQADSAKPIRKGSNEAKHPAGALPGLPRLRGALRPQRRSSSRSRAAGADAIPVRYRTLVLLATFASLRWGELVALRRENIDLETCEIRIIETIAEFDKGDLLPETPKSAAGRRMVAFPPDLVPELRWHLDRFVQPGKRGLVFIGPKGAPLRRSNFRPIWHTACAAAGASELHFHDLRHTGGTLAAVSGATIKELMARLGHSSIRAAMIYQHATRDRDQVIAKALGGLARQAQANGCNRPRNPRTA